MACVMHMQPNNRTKRKRERMIFNQTQYMTMFQMRPVEELSKREKVLSQHAHPDMDMAFLLSVSYLLLL